MALTDAREQVDPTEQPERQRWTPPAWFSVERAITVVVLTGAVAFIFGELYPRLILADTTPAGGDMGAHVWAPDYLREHLLPSLRLTGWAPDWYAGFPIYHFYMVPPSLAIVALDLVMPYGVAFKLVSVSGLLAMPLALYAFGRLARVAFPGPLLFAVAGVAFLFTRTYTIYGGNVASTLAGEFAFTISLVFAVLFLGVVLRGLETGGDRALAAVLLGATALCHVIPGIFAVVGLVVALLMRPSARRLWWVTAAGVAGGAITAWWTVPFVWRRAYLNDMGWEKIELYWERLFPGPIGTSVTKLFGGHGPGDLTDDRVPDDLTWIIVFAVVGLGVSIALRRRPGMYLGVLAIVFAVGFRYAPQGRLWNARLLPFWYLCLYLLAALAVLEIAHALAVLLAKDPNRPVQAVLRASPVVVLAGTCAFLGMGLWTLPGGTVSADFTTYRWLGFETTDKSFIRGWAEWNYSGYERKAAYPDYRALVDTMAALGRSEHGCGRAMWEYGFDELNRFGTPMAPMLLPYWTDGCIGSMEGLYFEASATTPYHFLNQSELSTAPSRPQRDLQYGPLDVDLGVRHLQLLGVKYYMAFSEAAVREASVNPDLTEVGASGAWHIYVVDDAPLVESVTAEPVVVRGAAKGGRTWLDMAEAWYLDPDGWDVLHAAGGPDEWARIDDGDRPAVERVRPVRVTNVDEGNATISFDVSDIGTPVLVKTSYFPNWEAHGADGPWRVAPNLMVVVPTAEHVELRYGRTPVEWMGWLITAAGIGITVLLARRPALVFADRPRPAPQDEPVDVDEEPITIPL